MLGVQLNPAQKSEYCTTFAKTCCIIYKNYYCQIIYIFHPHLCTFYVVLCINFSCVDFLHIIIGVLMCQKVLGMTL